MWQKLMIFLARSEKLKIFFQSRRQLHQLATRFVGGQNKNEAIKTVINLMNEKIYTSLFYLGEYEKDMIVINKTIHSLQQMSKLLSQNNLDIHISVDPTQVGLQIDKSKCYKNLVTIGKKIKENQLKQLDTSKKSFLMLDMEDSSVYKETLNFYNKLKEKEIPTAITLQAYLYQTEEDLKNIIKSNSAVRLVKGAFAENKTIAFKSKEDIDKAYRKLATLMLSDEAKKSKFYPIFATHDDKIIDYINKQANTMGWKKNEYEFEMLFGVRVNYQKELVNNGYKLRLYLPYGKDWWPYAIRRVGEKPQNIKYLFRN
ncbi:proline dehydrogenase family protein [Zunongwangia sp.]|uniref:proline dehydrogenase family protein n=1 Tax=Zunongwangia sp. TaxID=1965325 RepID=UPI003AA998DF